MCGVTGMAGVCSPGIQRQSLLWQEMHCARQPNHAERTQTNKIERRLDWAVKGTLSTHPPRTVVPMKKNTANIEEKKLLVSFRGQKIEILLKKGITAPSIKSELALVLPSFEPQQIKLLWKGKVLTDDDDELYETLLKSNPGKKTIRLVATGISQQEANQLEVSFREGTRKASIEVRDDLTTAGQAALRQRAAKGRRNLAAAAAAAKQQPPNYGFGRIETLAGLPDEDQARRMLTNLANDPGVLACMAKHEWNVSCLAELYPKGNVGQSPVCVMGLNENKGQKILLRLRTDDLQGFRKLQSIKQVLYHELAHNVYSDHDDNFFQLMRQIELECKTLDWTQGSGLQEVIATDGVAFQGGTYRLGGSGGASRTMESIRELAARAAERRMTAEEKEIEQHCGCGMTENQSSSSDEEKEGRQ
jgi:hypothetical protein